MTIRTHQARHRKRTPSGDLAGIQYAGEAGITHECVKAVVRLLQCDAGISRARLLSASTNQCLLLTVYPGDLIAIKSGFTSGYRGEGPAGLSRVLCMLYTHKVDIAEFAVEDDLIARVDASALTTKDIERLDSTRPLSPDHWTDYVDEDDWGSEVSGTLWRESAPVIPFAIIDPRIFDLARTFWDAPDERLLTGYRRLEDTLRTRTSLDEHGAGLFTAVFLTTPPKLEWKDCGAGEHKGRAQLFTAAYMAYRNPRAHRETKSDSASLLGEFLLLNHLYSLERLAVDTAVVPTREEEPIDPVESRRAE